MSDSTSFPTAIDCSRYGEDQLRTMTIENAIDLSNTAAAKLKTSDVTRTVEFLLSFDIDDETNIKPVAVKSRNQDD